MISLIPARLQCKIFIEANSVLVSAVFTVFDLKNFLFSFYTNNNILQNNIIILIMYYQLALFPASNPFFILN